MKRPSITKYVVGGVIVLAFIAYLIFSNKNSAPATTAPSGEPSGTPSTVGPTSAPTTVPPSGGPPASISNDFTSDLAFGATGTEVSALQQFLISNNYLVAVSHPTGYFGSLTRMALSQFQIANNIGPITGTFDTTTRALVNSGLNNTLAATTSTPSTPRTSTGQYKDGTYTGSVVDAFYGNFQVSVTIQGGLITDVTFPQAPSGGHSSVVSAMAEPALKQEAITAQSANVNIVSGATQDSESFQQSLAAALAMAKN